jgi:hypothetical protein
VKHSDRSGGRERGYALLPAPASLAALRARYEGIPARTAVERYLSHRRVQAQSSRGVLGRIRQRLIDIAQLNSRADIVVVFEVRGIRPVPGYVSLHRAIDTLRETPRGFERAAAVLGA